MGTMAAEQTIWGLDTSSWAAIAAWVTALVAIAAAVFALSQVLGARSDRKERQRPLVVVDFEPVQGANGIIMLRIRNLGQTTARDVVLTYDKPITDDRDAGQMPEYLAAFANRTYKYLPPGKVMDTVFTHLPERPKDLTRAWTVTIQCNDHKGKPQETQTALLDLDDISQRIHVSESTMTDLVDSVRKIQKSLEALPVDRDGLNVVTESYSHLLARKAAEAEERWLPNYRWRNQIRRTEPPP